MIAIATDKIHEALRIILVSPHTQRREDLIWTGWLRVLTIRLPAALTTNRRS